MPQVSASSAWGGNLPLKAPQECWRASWCEERRNGETCLQRDVPEITLICIAGYELKLAPGHFGIQKCHKILGISLSLCAGQPAMSFWREDNTLGRGDYVTPAITSLVIWPQSHVKPLWL